MNLTTPQQSPECKEKKYEAHEVVTMFARYTGAWQEYSQRINARHQIVNMWILTTTGLIIFFSQKELGADMVVTTAVAMPALAIAMFCMLSVHDLMMMRLSHFMRRCELHNNEFVPANGGAPLPNYRSDPMYSDGFMAIRSLQNHVLAAASIVLWVATIMLDEYRHLESDRMKSSALLVTSILWVVALLVNYRTITWRSAFERQPS